jgi:hypothetical protein
MTSGNDLAGAAAGLVELAILCAAVSAGTVIGGVYGAVKAEPHATVKDAEAALKKAMTDMAIQQALGEHVLDYAQTQTRYPFELLFDRGPKSANEKVDYRPLAESGVDTVLEISALKLGLEGAWSVNPPVQVSMKVMTRLIRSRDNTSLYEQAYDYSSQEHKFIEWAANDAQLFREAVARAYQEISEDIVIELLLPHDLPL